MPFLKHIKKQLDQFVQPDVEPLKPSQLDIYSQDPKKQDALELDQRNIKAIDDPVASFEDTYKTSYSHGLEQIYALETVDLKSIKKLHGTRDHKKDVTSTDLKEVFSDANLLVNSDWRFDFDGEHCFDMDAFLLNESIRFLNLANHIENCLRQDGIQYLRDLMKKDWEKSIVSKGLGKGHIEEIQNKLKTYIHNKPLNRVLYVDFESWIRCLVPERDEKRAFLVLEMYDLSHLITLSPTDHVSVKKLSYQKKKEAIKEGLKAFTQQQRYQFFHERFQKVMDVFVKPWMRKRHGICTEQELMTRLKKIALIPTSAMNALQLFKEVYFDGADFFDILLHKVDHELYAVDTFRKDRYKMVIEKAESYFYHESVTYPLNHLVFLLKREFAKSWEGFEDGFIESCLDKCFDYQLFKSSDNQLMITIG